MFSWKYYVSLCHDSFCTPSPNFPVILANSWLPTFAFQSPMMKRTSIFGLISRRPSRSLPELKSRTGQLQILQGQWWEHRPTLLWWFDLEISLDHSVIFEVGHKSFILDSFVSHECYSISSEGFLLTVADIMVIWIKFAHSHPFLFPLIPKILMFNLAIYCLTTTNLPSLNKFFPMPVSELCLNGIFK